MPAMGQRLQRCLASKLAGSSGERMLSIGLHNAVATSLK